MRTNIYKPKMISKVLLIVCMLCVYVIFYFLLRPTSWAHLVAFLIPAALPIIRFVRDRIELTDEYILSRNAYMNKQIALKKIEDVDYESHWYGESAVITFRNKFDVLNTMHIACEYNVEEIVEEIQSRRSI